MFKIWLVSIFFPFSEYAHNAFLFHRKRQITLFDFSLTNSLQMIIVKKEFSTRVESCHRKYTLNVIKTLEKKNLFVSYFNAI